MRFAGWLRLLRNWFHERRDLIRQARSRSTARSAEVLEARSLLSVSSPTADTYQTKFGQTLVASGGTTSNLDVTLSESLDASGQVAQMEYSDPYGLLIVRNNDGQVTVIDPYTKSVVDRHSATWKFTDMDLTSDGRYLFVADYGGEKRGYDRPINTHYVHRFDLQTRLWVVHAAPKIVHKIEAVDAEHYLAQENDQWVEITLNEFTNERELSRSSVGYAGDMEFDSRTNRVYSGSEGSGRIFTRTIQNDGFVDAGDTGFNGTARSWGGGSVLSSDGGRFYYGRLQVDASNIRTNLQTFGEKIYAATGQIAFGNTGYYDASNANYLGQLGFQTTVYAVSEDGAHVWAFDSTTSKIHHYRIGPRPAGVLANDTGHGSATAELVQGPRRGVLNLQADGGFSYTPYAGYVGDDTFQYRLASGAERSEATTVTISIPQPSARPAKGIPDEYTIYAGQTLSTSTGDELFDSLSKPHSFEVGNDVLQLEYSPEFNLVFARTISQTRVYDADSGQLVSTRTASTKFTDMDLTLDGRFLFVADYGGVSTGYGTPIKQHYAHRFDVVNRTWEQRPTIVVYRIEAVSQDLYLAQVTDQKGDIILNDFAQAAELSRVRSHLDGDFEYDHRTGRVYHGSSGYSSSEIHVRKLAGSTLAAVGDTGAYGTAQYGGNETVLSSDGQHFYYGALQVEAADVRHNLQTFPEIIWAATGQVAFGKNAYYDAISGQRLGSLGITSEVLFVSDDGKHLWVRDGSKAVHYEIRYRPAGLYANDLGVSAATHRARTVTQPEHGTVTIQANGQFQYTPHPGFVGDDQFLYRGTGVLGRSTIASVTIHVQPPRLVAVADSLSAESGQTLLVTAGAGLKQNDRERFPGSTNVELVAGPQHGLVTLQPDGALAYLPELSFSGEDTFRYRLAEGSETSEVVTVTVVVGAPSEMAAIRLEDHILSVTLSEGSSLKLEPPTSDGKRELTIRTAGLVTHRVALVGVDFAQIEQVLVLGSDDADDINLGAWTRDLFPNLRTVTIRGGGGDDGIQGSEFDDDIDGGAGNDAIQAGAGNDLVAGGDELGNDRLDGGIGSDTLVGGTGRDTLWGGADNDLLQAGDSTVILAIASGQQVLTDGQWLGPDSDTLVGLFVGVELRGTQAAELFDVSGWTLGGITVNAGSGNDTIVGSSQDDTLNGGDGQDSIHGGSGHDRLSGDGGDDVLGGDAGQDTLSGGHQRDLLRGGDGDDSLLGEFDRDTLEGDEGQDTLDGGNEQDTLRGGVGDDQLLGNMGADLLQGDAGNDRLDGGSDNDTLNGGENDDQLFGSYGSDSLQGDAGDDLLDGGELDDSLHGGEGDDHLLGKDGYDSLSGEAGNDSLNGGLHGDRIDGGDGDDRLHGDGGDDSLQGGLGQDSLGGSEGWDRLEDNDGFVWYEQVTTFADFVLDPFASFGLGQDKILGVVTQVVLVGDDRDNVLDARNFPWPVSLIGGGGSDRLEPPLPSRLFRAAVDDRFDNSPGTTVSVDAARGVLSNDLGTVYGNSRAELVSPPEHGQLTFRDDGSFDYVPEPDYVGQATFRYRIHAFSQVSEPATVSIAMLPPRFVIDGTQLIINMRASTQLSFANTSPRYRAVLREGAEVFESPFPYSQISTVESIVINGSPGDDSINLTRVDTSPFPRLTRILIQGGDGNDTIVGSYLNDSILGGNGDDSIEALGGQDTVLAGDGNDEVDGGDGNDSLEAGAGDDQLNGNDGDDTSVGQAGRDLLIASPGKDVLRAGEKSLVLVGGDLNWILSNTSVKATIVFNRQSFTVSNTLVGQFSGAIVVGGDENNKYDASAFRFGNVIMTGGLGNDTLIGSPGTDILIGEEGADSLDGGAGHDLLNGELGNDTLRGNTGDDTLYGDDGNDSLLGDRGRDSLSGGLGDDVFRDGNGVLWFEDIVTGSDMILTANGIQGYGNDRFVNRATGLVLFGDEQDNLIDASAYRVSGVTVDADDGHDTVLGTALLDVIVGGDGHDNLSGLAGNDLLIGSDGDDSLFSGAGRDTLLGESGQDVLFGGADADLLLGGDDDDTLQGQEQRDTLADGTGSNSLDDTTERNELASFDPTVLTKSLQPPQSLLAFRELIPEFNDE